MMVSIADQATDMFFRAHVEERREREISGIWEAGETRHDEFDVTAQAEQQRAAADQVGEAKPIEPIKVDVKVGRNDPCPCGSGKKYKHCCGAPGR